MRAQHARAPHFRERLKLSAMSSVKETGAASQKSFYVEPSVPNRVARRLSPARAALLAEEASNRSVGVLADGASIVVTPAALLIVDDERVRARHIWHEIDRVAFLAQEATIKVYLVEDAGTALAYQLDGNVLEISAAVKERVDASVIHVDQTVTSDGTIVRVALRRDDRGEVYSQVTSLGYPRLTERDRRRIDDLERRVRQTVGLDR